MARPRPATRFDPTTTDTAALGVAWVGVTAAVAAFDLTAAFIRRVVNGGVADNADDF